MELLAQSVVKFQKVSGPPSATRWSTFGDPPHYKHLTLFCAEGGSAKHEQVLFFTISIVSDELLRTSEENEQGGYLQTSNLRGRGGEDGEGERLGGGRKGKRWMHFSWGHFISQGGGWEGEQAGQREERLGVSRGGSQNLLRRLNFPGTFLQVGGLRKSWRVAWSTSSRCKLCSGWRGQTQGAG